jgi:signal transduction histidine kinase
MTLRNPLRVLYVLLVVLIVAQGVWWVIYLVREGRRYEQLELRRLEAERRQAELALRLLPEARVDPARTLRESFPELVLEARGDSMRVGVDSLALASIRRDANRRTRMFLFEGTFFLVLLASGMIVLGVAHRAEARFRRTREIFLAGVTHEFRTPLAALRLHAETLARPELPEEARRALLPKLEVEVDRMEALVDQVLEAGRDGTLDPATFETLDAGEEAAHVLEEMDGYLRREHASVDARVAPGSTFRGRSDAFATALRNLVQNAAKHSRGPASIALEVASDEQWVRVAVRDSGPGIAKEHHARIFESFARVETGDRARTRGAGLGLYLAKRNVEAMGGRIELASEEGAGSTFTIVLPRVQAGEPAGAA